MGPLEPGIAGAYAWKHREGRSQESVKRGLFDVALANTPKSEVRRGIEVAATLDFALSIETVVSRVGNGRNISCQDTVPFCLWVAARHLDSARVKTHVRRGVAKEMPRHATTVTGS